MSTGKRNRFPVSARLVPLAVGAVVFIMVLSLSGCAAFRKPTGSLRFVGNVWPNGDTDDPNYLTYWNQVTAENGAKWGNVEEVRDEMVWTDLDNAYGFSRKHGIPFRLHTLVWGQSQPVWLGRLPADELNSEVEEWITALAERYPDVEMIDVVNEPFHAQPVYMMALGGPGDTRFDWIVKVFEMARQHFPEAELGLNEYGILEKEDATSGYLRVIRILKERKLIDYIGLQGHYLENVPVETIAANLERLAEEKLPIYITELDVGIEDDQAQLEKYKELMTLFASERQVKGVTLWGYREDRIYKKSGMLLRADGTERPALTWLAEFTAPFRK